ncbi:hypothetical protein L218DRAFT_619698 [Marasmius fiardii PR-910]|nr:hypothetical protein L218DRAFT_619698 [Marasmius fiardii PR-910]
MSTIASTWLYTETFPNSRSSASDDQTSESTVTLRPPESVLPSPIPTSDGLLSSVICWAAGLEEKYNTPIIIESVESEDNRTAIASGASFSVERASWKKNSGTEKLISKWGQHFAIKYVRPEYTARKADWKHILLEVRTLLHDPIRCHPNIVRMIGLSWDERFTARSTFPALLLELADCGTLEHLQVNEKLSFHVKKKLCHDVSKGLSILHSCGIVHGDLKHENVLIFLDKNKDAAVPYVAKLADFGGSVMDLERESGVLHMGTPPYNAPEARGQRLDADGIKSTDVYSLGILVWRTLLDGVALSSGVEVDGQKLTSALIDGLKRSDSLLHFAKNTARTCSGIDAVGLELMDFVFENTLQFSPRKRRLVDAVAGLQAKSVPEISVLINKAAEVNRQEECRRQTWRDPDDYRKVFIPAKYLEGTEIYDCQYAGPGHRPVLNTPSLGEIVFNPEKLKYLVNQSTCREIFDDLMAASRTTPGQHAIQIPNAAAAFFVFQCYCHEFGTAFDAEKACYWLKLAALSEEDCKEKHLARAWCWRVHRALGVPLLDIEPSILHEWIHLSITRGHHECIKDAMVMQESLEGTEEQAAWQRIVSSRLSYIDCYDGKFGMSYLSRWKLRIQHDLFDLDVLDHYIQEEFMRQDLDDIDDIFVNHCGDGLLHYAASVGHYEMLRHLVTEYEPDIDLPTEDGNETPLLRACKGGHLECALFLLDHGAKPDGPGGAWYSQEKPLFWLCSFSEDEVPIIADRLLSAGASLSGAGYQRVSSHRKHPDVWADPEDFFLLPVSPLSRAVMMESLPAVRTLLAHGADPLEEYGTRSSVCAIVMAAVLSLPKFLEILLSHLDTSPYRRYGRQVAIFDEVEMLRIALRMQATIHDPMSLQSRLSRLGEEYQSAVDATLRILHDRRDKAYPGASRTDLAVDVITHLVHLRREDLVQSLLKLDHSIRGHVRPLEEAVAMNHQALFRLLLEHGADMDDPTKTKGKNKLHLLQRAAVVKFRSESELSIAQYLIKHESPLESETVSPFMAALFHYNFSLADCLLQNGKDINYSGFEGLSTLACIVGKREPKAVEALKYLLNVDDEGNSLAGKSQSRAREEELPSFFVTNSKELPWTALHYALAGEPQTVLEKQVVEKMVRLLLSVEPYRDAIDSCSEPFPPPALWLAIEAANVEVTKVLLERGANPNQKTGWLRKDLTPLQYIEKQLQDYPKHVSDKLMGDDKHLQQIRKRYGLILELLKTYNVQDPSLPPL